MEARPTEVTGRQTSREEPISISTEVFSQVPFKAKG